MTKNSAADSNNALPLGLIAGSGDLPESIIHHLHISKRQCFVVGFEGITSMPSLTKIPHIVLPISQVGAAISALKNANVSDLILAGKVGRPNISDMQLDRTALRLLARLSALKSLSDDSVFRAILEFLEMQKFNIVSVADAVPDLMAKSGILGKHEPKKNQAEDILRGIKVVEAMGKFDIGQSAVIENGIVLAVEGMEGTDSMIDRAGTLRNRKLAQSGVLIKLTKPEQDRRIDLPTIGIATLERVRQAGLLGIAVEAGQTIFINKEAVIRAADQLGLFVIGVSREQADLPYCG